MGVGGGCGVGPSAEGGADVYPRGCVGTADTLNGTEISPPLFDFASVLAQFKGLRFAPPALRAAPSAPLSWAARAAVTAAPLSAERRGKNMLRIYPVALDWIEKLEPLIARIARGDRDLAGSCGARVRRWF